MTAIRWTTSRTTVHNLGYHIIFCPKYRRPVLGGGIRERLIELFGEKAGEMGVTIASLEVMPDHVHLFVKASPVLAPHFIVGQLTGHESCARNSRRLCHGFPLCGREAITSNLSVTFRKM